MSDDRRRRILVTGARGMLGRDVCAALRRRHDVTGVDVEDADISDPRAIARTVAGVGPDEIVHCAAYTNVDGCERDPETAFRVNAEGTLHVAEAAEAVGAGLTYISTDFVFDGAKREPYVESDEPNPLSVYGESKLMGERHVRAVCSRWRIVRTAWLFGAGGKNFVRSIVEAARAGKQLRVVGDQTGSPTFTEDLARCIADLLFRLDGICHVTNSGSCTWYELARAALDAADMKTVAIKPIAASEWPSPTKRPAYSVLGSEVLEGLGLPPLRSWREAVADYVRRHL
ncbi:MAG: dTDP-4-dehydrorhamnose reductase [Armatimonadota bacterium]